MNDLKTIVLSSLYNIRRFHMVIFIVIVVVGLMTAILLLNQIVLKTNSPAESSSNDATASFDQATITRIKQLKTASEPSTPLDFSKGRISPFSE